MLFRIGMGLLLASLSVQAEARGSYSTRGYIKPSTGTYVAPHRSTRPNSTKIDNYSTRGNINPYTGKSGTVDPYKPGR